MDNYVSFGGIMWYFGTCVTKNSGYLGYLSSQTFIIPWWEHSESCILAILIVAVQTC